jgi:hypothetical protein
MANIIKKQPMNSAAEKKTIDEWNKLSVSQKQQYWEMKSTEEQKKITNFLKNDKKDVIHLSTSNGESLTLKKIDLPLRYNEDFGHVLCDSQSSGKQIMVIHKATGITAPFSNINLSLTVPDHVIGLTPEETNERLMITHPFLELEAQSSKSIIMRNHLLKVAKKTGEAVPILKNYWRESICEDYLMAEKSIIHNYKNVVTQCNALDLLNSSVKQFFNVAMKYLYEIDVNTGTVMSTWQNIPVLKPILIDEEPRINYSSKPINPPLVLAQLMCRLVALKYDCEYTPNCVMSLPTADRFARIGSQAFKVSAQINAINTAQPLAKAEIIDTLDYLKGQIYSFKICKANLQNNKPTIFIMLELEEMKEVVDTARDQVGVYVFNQLFESFRATFRDMFNLTLCNIPGLNSSIQLIHLDHVMNIVSYINQNSKEAKPIIAELSVDSSPQEQELDRLCQSYKTHEAISTTFKKILPDNTYDETTKNEEFHQRTPKTLSIDFVKIEEEVEEDVQEAEIADDF